MATQTQTNRFRAVDLIRATREREELTEEAVRWLIDSYLRGTVAEYQMAAWLMAVTLVGISPFETLALTRAMLESGEQLDWRDLGERCVDKHSTGGVGDKVSLVVVPTAAALGLYVPKLSGRALGFTGGTLDKLESIPGFRTELSPDEMQRQVRAIGCAIAAASSALAPADRRLYALRDATATVESPALVASSIMSKKLAAGARGIVLDVKTGRGASLTEEADARALASMMVYLGRAAGRRMAALLSPMDQPLGCAVGNALEVREAIDILQGRGPEDARILSMSLAGSMAHVGGLAETPQQGFEMAERAVAKGDALATFKRLVEAQGGDPRCCDDPGVLPAAPARLEVEARTGGWIQSVDARQVALVTMALGAARDAPGESLDPSVGVVLRRKVADKVQAGEPLAEVHAATPAEAARAARQVRAAFQMSDQPTAPARPILLDPLES